MSIYKFTARDIEGHERNLSDYAGKLVLIVNTASACGLTPQYSGLETLQQTFKDDLVVLGFPCNQFGGQERKRKSPCSARPALPSRSRCFRRSR